MNFVLSEENLIAPFRFIKVGSSIGRLLLVSTTYVKNLVTLSSKGTGSSNSCGSLIVLRATKLPEKRNSLYINSKDLFGENIIDFTFIRQCKVDVTHHLFRTFR